MVDRNHLVPAAIFYLLIILYDPGILFRDEIPVEKNKVLGAEAVHRCADYRVRAVLSGLARIVCDSG